MNALYKNNNGFTLIELILVIAVLGILSSIAIPRISSMNDKANDANIAQVAGSIRTAMEVYYQENKAYPDEDDLTDWDELKATLEILEISDSEDYNIVDGSFVYNSDNSEDYEIIVESSSTSKKYAIENDNFEEYNE